MRVVLACGAALIALSMAACGGHPSAVAPKAPEAAAATQPQAAPVDQASATADPRDAAVPQVDGRPMWAANRKHTAQENATYQFTKNGADFGARTEDDYVAKAHAFVARPPAGAETLKRRNGDTLIYDARNNVFAVVTKDGAPRTLFKPREGASYWAEQKAREAKRSQSAASRERDRDDT